MNTISNIENAILLLTAELREAKAQAAKARPLTVADLHAQLTTLIEVGAGDYPLSFISNDNYGYDLGKLSLDDNQVTIFEF